MDGELLADQPLGEKLIKKGFWLYFFAYLIGPAGYIIKVLVSNSTSVADVGVLYSIVGFIGLLNVYNDLWLTESLQYFLPRYRINKQYNYIKTSIYISLTAQIITAIIIAIFLRIGAPRLAENYFHSASAVIILKYFCFYFLGINLFQSMQNIFVAFQNTFDYQFVDFVKIRSIVGFTVFFFFTGKQSIERYSLNWILWLGVGIIVASSIFYKGYRKHLLQGKIVWEKPMLKEYLKYALRCFIGLNIGTLFWQVIQQIIIIMMGPESAGYYTNFLSLFGISGVIVWPIMGLIFPMVSEFVSKKDTRKLSLLFNFFYTYFSVFSLSIAILMLVLGKELALIIFWSKFLLSWVLLSWSALSVVCNSLLVFNFSVMAGMGQIKERVKIMSITTALTIALSIFAIHIRWIYGGVIAFCFGQVSLRLRGYYTISKNITITIDWIFIIKNVVFISGMGFLVSYIKTDIFIFDDLLRYSNLGKLIVVGMLRYMAFGVFNRKKLMVLKNEVKTLRGK